MRLLKNSTKINLRYRFKWIMVAAPVVFAPAYILLACLEGYGQIFDRNPTGAIISNQPNGSDPNVTNVEIIREFIPPNGTLIISDSKRADRNDSVVSYYQKVTVRNDSRSYAAMNFYNNGRPMQLVAKFGPNGSDASATSFIFPCVDWSGSSEWSWGVRKNGGTCAQGVKVEHRRYAISTIDQLINAPHAALTKTIDLISDASPLNNFARYCGAVSASGNGWEYDVSQENWIDVFSPNASPCQETVQLCESNTGSECFDVTSGEWAFDQSNLAVSLRCEDDRSFVRNNLNGTDIELSLRELKNEAIAESKTSCAPAVISESTVIVQPYGTEATKVKTSRTDSQIIIDTLAGAAFVRSVADPGGKVVFKGERYIYTVPGRTRDIVASSTETAPLDCNDFRIPGDPEADEFAAICAQGNEAQRAPAWQQYDISSQAFQVGLLSKQITAQETEPPYASLKIPTDWTNDITGSSGSVPVWLIDTQFFGDFVAYKQSAEPVNNSNFTDTQIVYVLRSELSEDEDSLDEIAANLRQDDATATVRRVSLADGEGLEYATLATVDRVDNSIPVKRSVFYLIQGNYLYNIILDSFGEYVQQEGAEQDLRKIAQSFRLNQDQFAADQNQSADGPF
ncbi:MAG: hypothetical protein ACTS2F_12740 [Thainema sp.]